MSTTATLQKSALTAGRLPRWTPLAVGAAALAVSGTIMALIGFNLPGWVVIAWLLFVPTMFLAGRLVEGPQAGVDRFWTILVCSAFVLALLPLVSVIFTLLANGLPGLLDPGFLGSTMQYATAVTDQAAAAGEGPVFGGILHALTGSLLVTLAATLISVPIGLFTSIYLVEYSKDGWLSKAITFFVDVMTGIPSIVAGLFAAALLFSIVGPKNSLMGFTAAVALSVLMIPVVVRSTVEMLRVVPNELREASYALGVRKWRTIVQVVIPTAISGIASGVTLAIARVIGETAPILVTAGVAVRMNANLFDDWMMTLPVYIFRQLQNPTAPAAVGPSLERAWGAALVLVLLVMALNLGARLIARAFAPKQTGR
ncbi:phosphate ABC transporter permease PstA [Auraticoccus monumenti]|uniref:Phosphate transport system permease protein PstA n=1 Tax=Auraticoccus monumenti TaxID=675864 RepID=A0A1G7F3A8_9ACTN|nr:phosphate ABC transporter permease PstA [Auraticoccus monumenti]SDE70236.1 phosphate ABC transporter membrane protein 2, PhoT family [Auraticoccus monumenti]